MADRNASERSKKDGGTSGAQHATGSSAQSGAKNADTNAGTNAGAGQERDFGSEFEALKQDLASVRRDLSNLAGLGASTATESASMAKDRANRMMGKARDAGSSAMDGQGRMMSDMRHRIGEHPTSAMAMALGIGFLAGWIVSRR